MMVCHSASKINNHDNCAEVFNGAWWFKSCYESHLNGEYFVEGEHKDYFRRTGILWNTIHDHASLSYVTMMIKPNHDLVETEPRLQKRQSERLNHID